MRLPPLSSLRTFSIAARRRSIVGAAAELNVTHGAVSKQVQGLERDLGAALFERRNRGVYLTPAGAWLADRLDGIFADLERTMREFRERGNDPGPLTISCEPTLCLRMLIPALPELKQATGLDVRMLAAGGPIDIRRDHIDLAIRRSDFAIPPALDVTVLAPERMGPVMAPGLAGRALDGVAILHSATRPHAWRDWGGRTGIAVAGPAIRYEHFYLALQAAEAGQGAAIASVHMVADALAAGRLVAPFGFVPDGSDYLGLHPRGRSDERSRAVLTWLTARMAEVAGSPNRSDDDR